MQTMVEPDKQHRVQHGGAYRQGAASGPPNHKVPGLNQAAADQPVATAAIGTNIRRTDWLPLPHAHEGYVS
jgi:hypothetical protein